jgi:hypothetical protein
MTIAMIPPRTDPTAPADHLRGSAQMVFDQFRGAAKMFDHLRDLPKMVHFGGAGKMLGVTD